MASTAPIPLRQLRLALVCSGGVSLAIYMHGLTRELHHLVIASRAFDRAYQDDPRAVADAPNPFDAGDRSEHAYFEELRDQAVAGRPVSVVIDVISGTSAGGINGVCLAKVLAVGGSQRALRDLWMKKGDLRKLLVGPRVGLLHPQVAVAGLRVLAGLALRHGRTYPLRGDEMSRSLYDAIGAMDEPETERLVPDGNDLRLMVTATDLDGFDVLVPAGGGGPSQHALDHRQVLTFAYEKGSAAFGPGDTGALAFAARATSAFPGAFVPVSLESFAGELAADGRDRTLDRETVLTRLRWQRPDGSALFADGGVLNNQPFDLAVDAIARMPAETEVIRRLVYIEPVPGGALVPAAEDATRPPRRRGLLPDLKSALIGARSHQPVLGELTQLRDLNLKIKQVGDITLQHIGEVMDAIDVAGLGAPRKLDRAAVRHLTEAMHKQAVDRLGPSYGTYCRLKLDAAADEIADHLADHFEDPPGSNRREFARAVIHAWLRLQPSWTAKDHLERIALLDRIDVPYRLRRLKFVLAGINHLYGTPGVEPEQLNRLKAAAWTIIGGIRDQIRRTVAGLPAETTQFLGRESMTEAVCLTDPAVFASEFEDRIATLVKGYDEGMSAAVADIQKLMWTAFGEQTRDWDDAAADELLSRYAAFPLWDSLIFPVIALSPVPQFTPIGVTRFSPLDARRLAGVPKPKLKGVSVHHFGGFLKTEYRENDYLWGRLDGAELCLNTLRSGAEGLPSGTQGHHGPHLDTALRAVLTAEADLKRVSELRSNVAAELRKTSPR
jgi:patatin-related protein